jgi:xylan 1,4-beta-xylosidase
MKPENPYFHAHHAPMGALSTFTCGAKHAHGGMGIELTKAYAGEIAVGFIDDQGVTTLLPFMQKEANNESERYFESQGNPLPPQKILEIERDYRWATDHFIHPQCEMTIYTPFFTLPDPEKKLPEECAFAACPAVHVRLTYRNTSSGVWKGFFGLTTDQKWSSLDQQTNGQLKGVVSRGRSGLATTHPSASSFVGFDVDRALRRDYHDANFLLGALGGIEFEVPAGQTMSIDIALGFYVPEVATQNREMHYYYTRHFTGLQQVLTYALAHRQAYVDLALERDRELEQAKLNDEQKFLIAHATRSYYGSTQWLWDGFKSVWVVNEGEYLMMNTFDLTVDMLFFEMRFNPWTVKNVLNYYKEHYSYIDRVFDPSQPEVSFPGGISFTHDMGVVNEWSPTRYSSYELSGLDRLCFSYMTCEQLTNWVLCAGVYIAQTQDMDFLTQHRTTLMECLTSLQNRDNPNPALRNGIMSFESSRTEGGGEITTYDSLDHSLGQSRHNIYLGGKMWASCVILNHLFSKLGLEPLAQEALHSSHLAAATLSAGFDKKLGYTPAVLGSDSNSTIIPAIEALVYPYEMGLLEAVSEQGPYGEYIKTLKVHLKTVLHKDLCLYPDGGWKLSSSADNSWMSKINLCQYIARKILGFDFGHQELITDHAHARWEREGSNLSACSDQFRSGVAMGSLYYPRIVTNILWLKE